MRSEVIHLPDLDATRQLAQRLSLLVRRGDVLALEGDLGTGKTAFARSLLQALGVMGDIPSPTFTLLQTYETDRGNVYHLDLYRLQSSRELDELGWDEARADGIVIVEWPERAVGYMPLDRLVLTFGLGRDGQRTCVLGRGGSWIERLKDPS